MSGGCWYGSSTPNAYDSFHNGPAVNVVAGTWVRDATTLSNDSRV